MPDRARRKAFAVVHNDISGAIRINMVGREPKGKVKPGAELEAFCAQLTQDLVQAFAPARNTGASFGAIWMEKTLWTKIGVLLDHFPPDECAAFIRHVGYGQPNAKML